MLLCSLFIGLAHAQNRQVSGKVISQADGKPIQSVSVLVQGTNSGTQTGSDGTYSIQVSDGATLVFKYVGFVERTVKVGTSNIINIQLEPEEGAIDEVVVVGYGTGTNLSTVVGSVAKVSSKDIKNRPTANMLESMQGKVPGLQVFTGSGEPSATQSIRLRGVGSLGASSSPLIVVDGIPVEQNSIVSMNPADFESITVLKDASATSIYGSRAANGVIYFTTRKGVSGESATITLSGQAGVSNLAQTKMQENMMNADELLNFWLETGNRTQAQIDQLRKDYPNDFDWFRYYYKEDRPIQQYDMSISGGSPKTTYYISGSYFDQEGIMYRSAFDRFTGRANIDSRLNDWLRVGLNLAGGYDTRETNGWGSNSTNGGLALLAPAFYTPYDADGNEYYGVTIPGLGRLSPKYLADKQPSIFKRQSFNPTGYLQIQPIEGLTFRSQVGLDHYIRRQTTNRLPSFVSSLNNGSSEEGYVGATLTTWTNTLEYAFNLEETHNFKILAGQEYINSNYSQFGASSTGQVDDKLILLGAGPANRSVSQTASQYAFSSFFGRASYNFATKYYFDVTIRQDRSSRFGRDKDAALFYSVGGMWDMKQEDFLSNTDWLSGLKLRASYGTTGNAEIGNYRHLALAGTAIYNGANAWGMSQPGNPSLGWEKQAMFSVGVNAELFQKLDLSFEYYNRTTNDMLVLVPYAYTTGWSDIYNNVGSLNNKGVDVSASYRFNWDNGLYITPFISYNYNTDKVTELFQGKNYWNIPNTGVTWVVGQPVMYFYPIHAGVNPETGLNQWYVPGEDQMVNTQDPSKVTSSFSAGALQQNTGLRRYPPHNGGFGLDAGYKGFTLSASFAFSKGKYLINNDRYFYENPYNFSSFNQSRDVLDYWKKPGDQTQFAKWGTINQFDTSLLEDASFLRLKTLTLAYNLPRSILGRTNFFKGARVFYTGRNVFTVTKYLGPDPEVDSNLALGINPNTKQSTFGLEIQF